MLSYFPKETKQKKESSLSVILECHTLRTLLPSIKHAIFICTVAQILVSIPPDSCSDKKLKPPQQKKKKKIFQVQGLQCLLTASGSTDGLLFHLDVTFSSPPEGRRGGGGGG